MMSRSFTALNSRTDDTVSWRNLSITFKVYICFECVHVRVRPCVRAIEAVGYDRFNPFNQCCRHYFVISTEFLQTEFIGEKSCCRSLLLLLLS